MLKTVSIKHWLQAFKIMYVELHRAHNLEKYCRGVVHCTSTAPTDCIFYSYWHDYKALALALLRRKNPKTTCVARAHRWDVFAEQHNPPYLPLKKFIINNLSKTISISEAGKKAFESYLSKDLGNKVAVSRLGKFNHRSPLFEKKNTGFLICSCSNMINVKRIDKIIGVIEQLQDLDITWDHFGDGPLMHDLQKQAKEKLSKVKLAFMGMVPNGKILDFYAENYVDLFVNLSDSEGIPVSIMETLSAAIPVLATNVGGTAECVNAKNGFLVEKNSSIADIAAIIESFAQANATEKRQKAYKFWQGNYETGKNYDEFMKLLL